MNKLTKSVVGWVIVALIPLVCVHYLTSCTEKKKGKDFTGVVLSMTDEPLTDAEVDIGGLNGLKTQTNKRGEFSLTLYGKDTLGPMILNVGKFGYGLFSRTFNEVQKGLRIRLTKGTTQTFAPGQPIQIQDMGIGNSCAKPEFAKTDFSNLKTIPKVYDAQGNLVDFGLPKEFKDLIDLFNNENLCNPGASVSIQPNAFVTSNGQTYNGPVQIAITTVDIYSPDGMPGDYTVQLPNGETGYMETYGAVNIEVRSEKNEKLQLNKKMRATVTVPVDPYILRTSTPPDSIPFLYYNTETGLWEQDGFAKLAGERDRYVATARHFSTMNMDLVKKNQSCFQVRQAGSAYTSTYEVEVIVPSGPTWPFRTRTGTMNELAASGKCIEIDGGTASPRLAHAVYHLPNDAMVGLVFRSGGNITDVAIVTTSAATTLPGGKPACGSVDCALGGCPGSCCGDPETCSCGYNQCANVLLSNEPTAFEVIALPKGGGQVEVRWAYTGSAAQFGIRYCSDPAFDCESFCVPVCPAGCAVAGECGPCVCTTGSVFSTTLSSVPTGDTRVLVTALDAGGAPIGAPVTSNTIIVN